MGSHCSLFVGQAQPKHLPLHEVGHVDALANLIGFSNTTSENQCFYDLATTANVVDVN